MMHRPSKGVCEFSWSRVTLERPKSRRQTWMVGAWMDQFFPFHVRSCGDETFSRGSWIETISRSLKGS